MMETNTDPGRADAHSGDLAELRRQFAEFGEEMNGLRDGVAVLKTDVAGLNDNLTVLEVKADQLQTDVSQLKTDMADVRGSLKEILDRLPAKAA
jgi:predicted nuclease with TOPRIM domain